MRKDEQMPMKCHFLSCVAKKDFSVLKAYISMD